MRLPRNPLHHTLAMLKLRLEILIPLLLLLLLMLMKSMPRKPNSTRVLLRPLATDYMGTGCCLLLLRHHQRLVCRGVLMPGLGLEMGGLRVLCGREGGRGRGRGCELEAG
jgi:hypothetical protein